MYSDCIQNQTISNHSLRFTISLHQHLLKTSSTKMLHLHSGWCCCSLFTWVKLCLPCVLRFLMCDGGRGRLWRALLIASRVQLETRRTDVAPALWSSVPSVSLWLRLHDHWSQQARTEGVNLTLPPKRSRSPSWHRVRFESVDLWRDSIALPKTSAGMNITAPSCIDSVSAFICVCFSFLLNRKMFWKQSHNCTIRYLQDKNVCGLGIT